MLMHMVDVNTWLNSPVIGILAGALATVIGGLLSFCAVSRSNSAQDKRVARREVFEGFEVIAKAHAEIVELAPLIGDGDERGIERVETMIKRLRPQIETGGRRIRVHNGTLSKPLGEYLELMDQLCNRENQQQGYRRLVNRWRTKYDNLEKAISKVLAPK